MNLVTNTIGLKTKCLSWEGFKISLACDKTQTRSALAGPTPPRVVELELAPSVGKLGTYRVDAPRNV